MGEWAILHGYRYEPVEVVTQTAKTISYKCWNYEGTKFVVRRSASALKWRGTNEAARDLAAQLNAALERHYEASTALRREQQAELAMILALAGAQ